jgi:hypothetical protein
VGDVTCRHCHEPVERCRYVAIHGVSCQGWVHSATTMHLCTSDEFLCRDLAEPEPGTLPVTEAPASKPQGEVA